MLLVSAPEKANFKVKRWIILQSKGAFVQFNWQVLPELLKIGKHGWAPWSSGHRSGLRSERYAVQTQAKTIYSIFIFQEKMMPAIEGSLNRLVNDRWI